MTTNQELRKIMKDHDVSVDTLVSILKVSKRTVDRWLLPADHKTYVGMPRVRLEMLKIKLGVES